MSDAVYVEHIWCPPDLIPFKLQKMFPNGAAIVFADEEFTAAIPASEEETKTLEDLMEVGAEHKSSAAYFHLCDRLCGDKSFRVYSSLWLQEMQADMAEEDRLASSKYAKMASAARFN